MASAIVFNKSKVKRHISFISVYDIPSVNNFYENFNGYRTKSLRNCMKLIMFSFSEPFLEAVPQVMVMMCIAFLSGHPIGSSGRIGDCAAQNCGIVSIIPTQDPWFFGTFCLSVFSASFGMTRFLKVGPMTLVPRNSYGLSFFVALFLVAIAIVSKGAALAFLLTRLGGTYTVTIAVWLGICVFPSFFYVSTYTVYINFAMHKYLLI